MATAVIRTLAVALLALTFGIIFPIRAGATERLCDPSFENCRTPLLALIDNEKVGLDVAFWFMEDYRYASHIVSRWKAGVPVRVIVDPRATPSYPANATMLNTLEQAGIPMRYKVGGGIMHLKMMLFAGQNTVEFGAANYSENAFLPAAPYANYVSETIYFCDDPLIVDSFKTKYDNLWADTTNYANYANVRSLAREYPTFAISPDMNFPPGQSYATRAVTRYNAETQKIDVNMYRVTDRRHSDAMMAAWQRGIPVRYLGDTKEYRNKERIWVSWNMDRMWLAGIPMRVCAHLGMEHEKLVLLYSQGMAIFGSSNWTSPSANSQQEHNYFTTKSWIFQWFVDQFERKWNNTNPLGAVESKPFVPLAPDKPVYRTPANLATGIATNGGSVKWYGGLWAHVYDVYLGTAANPPLFAANLALGPSETTTQYQSFALPPLTPGTTYFWKIVSRTAANKMATGPVWSFTTSGTTPPLPGGGPYRGTPIPLPGRIQAEDYDLGGAGVAYYDVTSGNSGGAYRNDSVDIQATTDGDGYNIGWVKATEWLKYTVNVATEGTYAIDIRVASNGVGGIFHVEVDGVDVTGTMAIPSTGGWQVWTTLTRTGVALTAGTHVVRARMDANGATGSVGNFNWITVR